LRYIAISLVALGGCCVCPVVERPYGISQLVDARTGRPIPGATVHAETVRVAPSVYTPLEIARSTDVTTDANGHFFVDAEVHWRWVPMVADAVPTYLTRYEIQATGYRTLRLDPFAPGARREEIQFGPTVELQPLAVAQRSR
jgi:hypothetical protein